jgi:membrane protease YdiL (CAAX protease family)
MTISFENQLQQKTSIEFLKRRSLVIGVLLMFLYTWTLDLSKSGVFPMQLPLAVYLTGGWGFILVSLFMTWFTLGSEATMTLLKRFLIWRVEWKWYFVAFLLLPILQFTSVWLTALQTGVPADFSNLTVYEVFPLSVNALVLILPWFLFEMLSNGEEMGWRGYILPRLQEKYTALVSSLILGVTWGFWHLPKFLGAGTNSEYSFAWFVVAHVALAVLYTWLYNNTRGSLLLVTFFHASGNTAGMLLPISFAATGGILPNMMIVLYIAAAILVTIIAGHARLSRTQEKQVQK